MSGNGVAERTRRARLTRRVAGLPAWGWLGGGLASAVLAVAVLVAEDPPATPPGPAPSADGAGAGPAAPGAVAAGLPDADPVPVDRPAADPIPAAGATTAPSPTARRPSPAVAAPIPALATVPPSVGPPAPIHHEGAGGGRQALAKPGSGVVVARVSHDGAGAFTVHALDSGGSRRDLLVSSVGPYRGARLLDSDGRESAQIEVRADGPWTVDLVPLAAAPPWSGREPLHGQGDAVVVVPGGLSRFTLTQVVHGGVRSFAVWAYSATSRDLVVNRVGRHDGRHALAAGVLLLAVTADGPWSITPRSS